MKVVDEEMCLMMCSDWTDGDGVGQGKMDRCDQTRRLMWCAERGEAEERSRALIDGER